MAGVLIEHEPRIGDRAGAARRLPGSVACGVDRRRLIRRDVAMVGAGRRLRDCLVEILRSDFEMTLSAS